MSPVQNPGSEPVKKRARRKARPSAVSGGAATFLPTDIAGLRLWLRADSLSLNDGDAIGTWSDESGEGTDMTQSTTSKKPTYKTGILNGQPVVRFDGGDLLSNATANWRSGDNKGTVFCCHNPTSLPAAKSLLSSDDIGSQDSWQNNINSTGRSITTYRLSAALDVVTGDTVMTTGNTYIQMWSTTGSAWVHRVNGTAQSLSLLAGSNNGHWLSDTPTLRDNVVTGAVIRSVEESQYIGDVGEVIYYDTELGAADIASVESYLASKWGVTL